MSVNMEKCRMEQHKRMEFAIKQITGLGYSITHKTETQIQFLHKEKTVTLWPYTGYFNGKSVKAARGITTLIHQLKAK